MTDLEMASTDELIAELAERSGDILCVMKRPASGSERPEWDEAMVLRYSSNLEEVRELCRFANESLEKHHSGG